MESKKRITRVGIFSGTFDPVHEGHLQFARDAARACKLNKVFFLVEPRPRRKQGVRAFEHRTRMVQLAIASEPKFASIVLEQQRFTPHETLPVLKTRFKGAKLFVLMGDDMLTYLNDWPHVEDLIEQTEFIIGVRGEEKTAKERLESIEKTRNLNINYKLFVSSLSDYSSSGVRLDLRRGRRSDAIPKQVSDYINEERLYSSGDES